MVLDACERMHAHLTAAVVSNDQLFLQVIFAENLNHGCFSTLVQLFTSLVVYRDLCFFVSLFC